MSRFWSGCLWSFVALVCIGLIVVWVIPTPQKAGDATESEKEAVIAGIREVQKELPYAELGKMKAHNNRVVEVNVTWTGENPPAKADRQAWGIEADRIALHIASNYLPEGWQINVALWHRRLPRGVAGRSAGDDPEGGPAWLFQGREPIQAVE